MSGFVALVSGGKDSLYSIMECMAHGYRLDALLNLTPVQGLKCAREIDSYMYQSVATDCVHLIATALDVPLYQFPIKGKATCQSLHYSPESNDEVEDLFRALTHVKLEIPSIEFVSSGAILSDYQRLRVEHVASRLSIRSLAFLWQRRTSELLNDMLAASLDAIIVKIAGFGLKTDNHLGARLGDIHDSLLALSKPPWCLNVCGEGGEYETLTLDCPLFRTRIHLRSKPRVVVHSTDDVAYLQIEDVCLMAKPCEPIRNASDLLSIVSPDGRKPFRTPAERLADLPSNFMDELTEDYNHSIQSESDFVDRHLRGTPQFSVINCIGEADTNGIDVVCASRKATSNALAHLNERLASNNFTRNHVVHNLICTNQPLISSILDAINEAYQTFFCESATENSYLFPPARTLVSMWTSNQRQSPLTSTNVSIQILSTISPTSPAPLCGGSYGLRVRSISHWAPASDEFTSQAIRISQNTDDADGLNQQHVTTIFSGQIGLIPESLTLPVSSELNCSEHDATELECWLALRHCHRLMKVLSPYVWSELHLAICFATSQATLRMAKNMFHTSICSKWSCVCESRLLFCQISGLPHDASLQWQVVCHNVVKDKPFEYVSSSAQVASDSWLLICPRTCAALLSPNHAPVLFIDSFLDGTDCVAVLHL